MGGVFPLALQYTEVAAYAKDAGYRDPVTFEEFVTLMYAMDDEYIKQAAAKAKRKKK